MTQITYPFDDLPLVRDGDLVALRTSGKADISYDQHGNWRVEGIELDGDNDTFGASFRGVSYRLRACKHRAIWKLIDAAIHRERNADVVDLIVAALPHSDPHEEHRLTARDLGVGAFARAW